MHNLNEPKVKCKKCRVEFLYEREQASQSLEAALTSTFLLTQMTLQEGTKNCGQKFSTLPKLDKGTIGICTSTKHALHFDIVEDDVFTWAFNTGNFSREQISNNADGKFTSILLNCWIHSITGYHHLCFILKTGNDLFYWTCFVTREKTAKLFYSETEKITHMTNIQKLLDLALLFTY